MILYNNMDLLFVIDTPTWGQSTIRETHAPRLKREEKQKFFCPLLKHIIIRCMAWGFSSSGCEQSFSQGQWLKSRREITQDGINDELRAMHVPSEQQDQLLALEKAK